MGDQVKAGFEGVRSGLVKTSADEAQHHIIREFQRWNKEKQADHLREHGVDERDIQDGLKRQTPRSPVFLNLYQQHVTVHHPDD